MKLLEPFYPDRREASAYSIPYARLYHKGYRAVLFDIDNTLVPHGQAADDRAVELFDRLRQMGFGTCLLSNNKEERVASFARQVGADYIFDAHKPSVKSYLEACRRLGVRRDQAIFVGDQLFTDIWGARRAGLHNILVDPIHPREEIQIILKRKVERLVLKSYEKDRKHVEKAEEVY